MTIAAPPRCGYRNEDSIDAYCARPAQYEVRRLGAASASFVCSDHAMELDRLIVDGTLVRVVTLTCEIVLTGISSDAEVAEAEARTRVQLAGLGVGAIVDVQGVTSSTVRYRAPRLPRAAREPRGDG